MILNQGFRARAYTAHVEMSPVSTQHPYLSMHRELEVHHLLTKLTLHYPADCPSHFVRVMPPSGELLLSHEVLFEKGRGEPAWLSCLSWKMDELSRVHIWRAL